MSEPCDACGESVADALVRTVRLSVDRSNIDTQQLCPECFAEWIAKYQNEMSGTGGDHVTPDQEEVADATDDGSDIIVD